MQELIVFNYSFCDGDGEEKNVEIKLKSEEEGLTCENVCEVFEEFMESAGYSLDNVQEYFS